MRTNDESSLGLRSIDGVIGWNLDKAPKVSKKESLSKTMDDQHDPWSGWRPVCVQSLIEALVHYVKSAKVRDFSKLVI